MALRIWLPLDGTLENKGISNITVTNNGATVNASGKIGQCYQCDGSHYISFPSWSWMSMKPDYNFSLFLWIKGTTTGWLIAVSGWELLLRPTFIRIGLSGNGQYPAQYNASFDTNTWYHLGFTWSGSTGKLKLYLNGSEVANSSVPSTANFNVASTIKLTYDGPRYLNDVRVYDHCLSAAEVREISQGLVLHYKLDGGSNPLIPNILNTLRYSQPNNATWGAHRYTGTQMDLLDSPLPWKKGTKFAVTYDTSLGSGGGGSCSLARVTIEPNTIYCYSLYIQAPDDMAYITPNWLYRYEYNATSGGTMVKEGGVAAKAQAIPLGNHWYRIYGTFTSQSTTVSVSCQFFTYPGKTITYYIGCPQLEKGPSMTPWNDGNIFTTITDSSGYGHNGTINGNPSLTDNTLRYSQCMEFHANTTDYITIPTTTLDMTNITFSAWAKWKTFNTWSRVFDFGEKASGAGYSFLVANNGSNLVVAGRRSGGASLPDTTIMTIATNTWYHICVTIVDTTCKTYVNGELKKTFTLNGSIGNALYNLNYLGKSNWSADGKYDGYISDFRIYCTALSAADVKQLYDVGAKIDNLQNIHTFEFIEGNTPTKITKQGQLKTLVVQEAINQSLAYDKTLYTEPDGSTWIHIFHHNNPAGSRFTGSANDWSNGIYIDANKWYNVEPFLNDTLPYEFIVKQKTTSDATETKYRWIQTPNPLTATWTDVKPGTVTFITTSGYSSSSYGGMYLMKSSNLHMCIANGSNGNWFGGIGASGSYNGGIPGYPNTTVTSGYIDLYLRIYPTAKIIKNIGVGSNSLIEK